MLNLNDPFLKESRWSNRARELNTITLLGKQTSEHILRALVIFFFRPAQASQVSQQLIHTLTRQLDSATELHVVQQRAYEKPLALQGNAPRFPFHRGLTSIAYLTAEMMGQTERYQQAADLRMLISLEIANNKT
jgi:hypothetical protein